MNPLKTISKPRIGQNVGAIGIAEVAREVAEMRPRKVDCALIAGFVVVLGAIFWSALHAVDAEAFCVLTGLFALVGAMFPVDAVRRLVG